MPLQSFAHIDPVPQSSELIDIALSKTNRKTPTVIHPGFEIQRVRNFYIRKVKHTAEEFTSRLEDIVSQFPVIEDIHPFYADLISVIYDRDHYKMALGKINTTKSRIEKIMAEHARLLKFGDSQYRCKQLKRAALGKMASTVKKLEQPLKYLEEVRQHISRHPAIDTTTRSIVICGYPNVGKSSFMNRISRAHVDVQPYAFTTKSLYVGHFEYENLRWQVIDTPGILDQPLEERNTIEMITITALAHLKSAVLFFMDLSETCGYSVESQISLYNTLTPLLASQVLIVLSKCDLIDNAHINNEIVTGFLQNKKYIEVSNLSGVNIEEARNRICNMLLEERVEEKKDKIQNFMHRIRPFVPSETNPKDDGPVCLGQSQFIGLPENETYFCDNKYDIVPEIYNGKNIADFMDAGIREKLNKVMEENGKYKLREYEVLTAEERRMYEDCNNARIHANMMAIFNKRASVPAHAKNHPRAEHVSLVKQAVPVVRTSWNKKTRSGVEAKKHFEMKPKHIYRPAKRN